MANTKNDFDLLNLEETTGSAQVTIIQQSTDVNLFYSKSATNEILCNKVDTSTLVGSYYNKANIDGQIATTNYSIASKANNSQLDNYYTKTQTDNLLTSASTVSVNLGNYYDKAKIDGKIATFKHIYSNKSKFICFIKLLHNISS